MLNKRDIARLIFRIVDIVTLEFSLALRHSSGRCSCKLWPRNENLIFENDFNARASRSDSDRAKPPLGSERARRGTFITSGMVTRTEEAR
jgi:hypothetical protein